MKPEVTYTYYSKQFDIVCEATGETRRVLLTNQLDEDGDPEHEDVPEYKLTVVKDGKPVEESEPLIDDELKLEFNNLKDKYILWN